ncbi:hypothetical protein EJ02DRAFT_89174 [Clathrospora elynae]|uniref:Uncharacterized protein n=1 Tax=Clathrospora elynae TaxID=706981 RepID=A0A6A5T368_9PLEO|nr:hypothetical protein EJ02DRAFT_89174 [Clathrospora elynae]
MAPQEGERRKGESGRQLPPPPDNSLLLTVIPFPTFITGPLVLPITVVIPIGNSNLLSKTMPPPYTQPTARPSNTRTERPSVEPSFATKTWPASASTASTYQEGGDVPSLAITPTPVASNEESPTFTPTNALGGERPTWPLGQQQANKTPMYAAAAIIPIIVLAIIGGVAIVCLRRRRRRGVETTASQTSAQEMKLQPQPQTRMRPYMAPPPPAISISQQYTPSPSQLPPTSTPSQFQPVILGPISSGSNGAYLTGIDTSDMVSMTSNNLRPVDPFSDNNSLSEPPPPYRPHSVAPPSFTSTSRQSSVRASARPATSQIQLMQRSPFDDPDDDTVSEPSGPTLRRNDDAVSAVSDLSYQNDALVERPPLRWSR